MKTLPTLQELANDIEASIEKARVVVKATVSEDEDLDENLTKTLSMQALVTQALRPPLNDITREHCVVRILEGLKGFKGEETQARVATSSYNLAWFQAEPDAELRKMLAKKLLECYGDSPSANKTLWEQFE